MPAGTASEVGAPPSIPLSFSNNFWGRDDAGVDPLLTRMQNSKTTSDELKAFYNARAALEEDYAKKLLSLSRKPLGSVEQGSLRASLDVARGETESMGKQHALIAQQMKSELEEPLTAFAGAIKERRKIVQNGIERLHKMKQAQTAQVNKCRDKYEQDCLRIKGYLAQGHMVMGQEERKNKAKLEKTQINMASNSNEYEAAVKVLEETTGRWNKEWKSACDKFQDLEEERLDFTKSSLWAFANIASTVCVSDDASCEKIRLALENCEVEKDISGFIKTCGTGQEIPDPPRYINFARDDVDTASEVSEDDYSVAQFARTTNPAFRSSSPTHSNAGSKARTSQTPDRHSERHSEEPMQHDEDDVPTPQNANSGRPPPLNYNQKVTSVPPNYSPSQHGEVAQVPHNQYPTEGMTMFCRTDAPSVAGSALSSNTRPESRDDRSDYSAPSSFTSAEPLSGAASPTKMAPINGIQLAGMGSPDKSVQKKRSGFFSNSPFRRKSRKDHDNPSASDVSSNRSTWNGGSATGGRINLNPTVSSAQSSPTKSPVRQQQSYFNRNAADMAPEGEEPPDPRANFQLNIGNNVFDVASPDGAQETTPKASAASRRGFLPPPASSTLSDDSMHDPIAQALANLKQSSGATGMAKQASTRVAVDRYHGVATPAPEQEPLHRPGVMSAESQARLAAQRGTPPPAYETAGAEPRQARRAQTALGVPQPAHTKREMLNRTETWGSSQVNGSQASRPGTRDGRRSPGPGTMRAASPQPQEQYNQPPRARSPAPGMIPRAVSPHPQGQGNYAPRSRSPAPGMVPRAASPNLMAQQGQYRAASPNPYGRPRPDPRPSQGHRQGSGMEMQLSSQDVTRYDGQGGSGRSRQNMMRPNSSYGGDRYQQPRQQQQSQERQSQQRGGGMDVELRRERSKSLANIPYRPGQPTEPQRVLHYARAMYSYSAAIPEELSFSKGDILAVLRIQDDGWWEAEVKESIRGAAPGGVGLVPSNYLQRC
ncbi:formin-binding protein [Cladophialophora chaetospira]|uniref:Formin-binding protein n=1 Tax=Cladophialophora chaetospira TaxID=386627 RepID=A0AA38XBT9_9EURO|nr:formin-binding protein [Cladophialophora chaetospira]